MYGIGQRVVHPMHGAGVIESVTEELLHGELSVALEIPKDEVREYIRQRVKAAEAAE